MIIAISDIHGMLEEFETLWDNVSPSTEDTVIILGDLIDRGPDSRGVVDSVLDKIAQGYNIIVLWGNHEDMYMKYIRNSEQTFMNGEYYDREYLRAIYKYNGGSATLRSYKKRIPPKDHMDFYRKLLPYYEVDNYIFTHAGLKPRIALERQKFDDCVWIREEFINSDHDFGKLVVFGHTPVHIITHVRDYKPFYDGKKLGIDTGCVYGGKLTALLLPEIGINDEDEIKYVQV